MQKLLNKLSLNGRVIITGFSEPEQIKHVEIQKLTPTSQPYTKINGTKKTE